MEVFYKEPKPSWFKEIPVTSEETRELVMRVGKKHVNEQEGYRLTFYYFMTTWYLTDVGGRYGTTINRSIKIHYFSKDQIELDYGDDNSMDANRNHFMKVRDADFDQIVEAMTRSPIAPVIENTIELKQPYKPFGAYVNRRLR